MYRKGKPLCAVGGIVNWYSFYGKHSLEREKIQYAIKYLFSEDIQYTYIKMWVQFLTIIYIYIIFGLFLSSYKDVMLPFIMAIH